MTRTTSTRRAMAGALVAAGLTTMVVAGCSHGSSKSDAGATTKAVGSTVKAPAPTADTIANDPKARPSVSMKDCAATGSGWSAGGTVTNSKDKAATFTIVVSFTTKQSTVLARGETKVTVKAGATKSWTTDANFAKSKGTQCVLRGVSES
jgi:hypothetical protein